MREDDAQVIARAITSGAPDDLLPLFERYWLAVEEVAARVWELEISEQAAAVEDAFLAAFAALPNLRDKGAFAPSLLGTAFGAAHRRLLAASSQEAPSASPAELFVDVSSLRAMGTRREIYALISEAVGSLSDPLDRDLAEACLLGEHTRPQLLAAQKGVEVAAVGHALTSALLRSKACLLARLISLSAEASAAQMSQNGAQEAKSENASAAAPVHLTFERYQAILEGGAPSSLCGPEFAAHLKSGCPICEEELRRLSHRSDSLDGVLWAALFADLPARRSHGPIFHNIIRRLKLTSRLTGAAFELSSSQGGLRNNRLPLALAGILAVLGLAVFSVRVAPTLGTPLMGAQARSESGMPSVNVAVLSESAKDADEAAKDANLTAAGQDAEADADEAGLWEKFTFADAGQRVAASSEVAISYAIPRSRFVALVRILPDGEAELLEMPGRVPAGTHTWMKRGKPARLPLRDADGRNRFVVIESLGPLSAEAILAAVFETEGKAGDSGAVQDAALPQGIRAAWFDIWVSDGGAGNEPDRGRGQAN